MSLDHLYTFIKWLFSTVLKEVFILFGTVLIGEWMADVWKLTRIERAWWITLILLIVLNFVLWFRFGRILLFN